MIITLLCLMLTAAAQDAAEKPQGAPAEPAPLQRLVTLVGDPSDDPIKEAEEAHAELAKAGPPPVTATYALALIYTREKLHDQAVKALDSLPNDAKYAPTIIRLRLYLALERGEKGLSDALVKLLSNQVSDDKSPLPERIDSARLLGGVIGALPPNDSTVLTPAVASEAVRKLTAATDQKISNAFRLAQSETAKRRLKLSALAADITDQPAAKQALQQTEAEQAAAAQAWQAAKANLAAKTKENQKDQSESTSQIRALGKQVGQIEKEWKLVTPGRPQRPVPPTEPRRPSRPGGTNQAENDNYQRLLNEYEIDMRTYQAKLRVYTTEQATYAQRLQTWEQADQQRRANLQNAKQKAEADVAAARELKKGRDDAADQLREEMQRHQAAAQELDLKVTLLKSVANDGGAANVATLLSRPSNYGLLSYSAERQRLLRPTR